jgi:hypothetical protein
MLLPGLSIYRYKSLKVDQFKSAEGITPIDTKPLTKNN